MQLPENRFKRAIAAGRHQIGLWCSLPGPYVAEAVAGSGFDWLLFDTEHSPGDPLTVLAQHAGQLMHPTVVAAVEDGIRRIRACGKLTGDTAFAARCIELGTLFIAVDVDAAMLARGTENLARQFKSG